MDDVISGYFSIKEEKVKNICLDIQSYLINIQKSLNGIDDIVDDSKKYYNDDTSSFFVEKKNNFMISKNNIITNISSYIDEYNNAITKFKDYDSSISDSSLNKNEIEEE
ncbi:MAG: hypothetical protein IJN90_00730 [Bacilli bacterium]|nr:hypothetical protein [Bacilli bacterium]